MRLGDDLCASMTGAGSFDGRSFPEDYCLPQLLPGIAFPTSDAFFDHES